jgi:hypothetical protein
MARRKTAAAAADTPDPSKVPNPAQAPAEPIPAASSAPPTPPPQPPTGAPPPNTTASTAVPPENAPPPDAPPPKALEKLPPRRVRTLRKCYIGERLREAGEVFVHTGPRSAVIEELPDDDDQ